MKLIITIDTEENTWNRYSATDNPVDNVEGLIPLQRIFDEYGFRATYLVTYPVATNPGSVEILTGILEQGMCEIGMHCHPWNTPPFDGQGPIRKQDTMLCNLPADLVHQKLSAHHLAICKNFGIVPVSFRAGRWGFGPAVAGALCSLGYRVDSSVTPYVSWKNDHGPDFTEYPPDLFRFTSKGLADQDPLGPLLEVPVTIGFLQSNFKRSRSFLSAVERCRLHRFRIGGILALLGLLNRVWLSPEMTNAANMIRLSRQMEKLGYPLLNLTFHSPSLQDGFSQFVSSPQEEVQFYRQLRMFFDFVLSQGWESKTLAELATSR